jgi:hypothetical protein
MLPIRYGKKHAISNYCIETCNMSIQNIKSRLFKVTKELVKLNKTQPYLFDIHKDLVKAWAQHGGLIYSPAAAFVSCVGQFGVEEGWSALATAFNGIATIVTVCKLMDDKINICCILDHRAWDGAATGEFYQFLKHRIPKILKEEVCV